MEGFDEYDVLGRRVLVGSRVPEARTTLQQLLRGFGPSPAATGDWPRYELVRREDVWFVHTDQGPVHSDRDLIGALGMLEWHVMTGALERHHHLFHLHGATLAVPGGGGAVALVGNSGSGKSTLTLALMQRGFLPFADDVALIDPVTLDVQSLRRAFHVSDPSLRLVESFTGKPVSSGGDAPPGFFHPPEWARAPEPVRWLLLLELRPDQTPSLTRLTPADAAVAVLEQSLNLKHASRVGLAAAARLASQTECYRFQHGGWPESLAIVEGLAR